MKETGTLVHRRGGKWKEKEGYINRSKDSRSVCSKESYSIIEYFSRKNDINLSYTTIKRHLEKLGYKNQLPIMSTEAQELGVSNRLRNIL